MSVPKLWGKTKVVPIISGTRDQDLAKGLGHYLETALPDAEGNFAVAGHRATHGEPFADFPLLTQGMNLKCELNDLRMDLAKTAWT